MRTGTGRLDSWLLGLEPEGLLNITDNCWETVYLTLLFDPGFSSPSLCRDTVSWSGWPYGASTVRQLRPRMEKQPGAGQARRVCQTVTLRCGSCCRGRRTGSVVAWNSLPQRWGLGKGAEAVATMGAGSDRSYCYFYRLPFQTQGLPALGLISLSSYCPLKQRQVHSGLWYGGIRELPEPSRAPTVKSGPSSLPREKRSLEAQV